MADLTERVPRLIVGLGNPGGRYEGTRHNVGFDVLDRIARERGFDFVQEKKWEVRLAKVHEPGEEACWFAKPQTFMNLSGRAVSGIARFYRIEVEEILVVYDDVALPLGTLRLRASGSAGGHNGMTSIIECLGGETGFPRLKLGIAGERGRPSGNAMSSHVLGRFATEEREAVAEMVERGAAAVEACIREGLGPAMNRFNQVSGKKKDEGGGESGSGEKGGEKDGEK